VLLAITAQEIRAILLASRRPGPVRQHLPGLARLHAVERRARRRSAACAGAVPILEMDPSLALPPVECCRRTRPRYAVNSRLLWDRLASGMLAERQEATIEPMRGMMASLSLSESLRWAARMTLSSLAICASIPTNITARGWSAVRAMMGRRSTRSIAGLLTR
jgi:hypothetical protein